MNLRNLYIFHIFYLSLNVINHIECQKLNTKECVSLDISLYQKIENEGFHRDIRWLIEINSKNKTEWNGSKCEVMLRLDVGSGFFANRDQLADLQRVNQISAIVEGTVNVETPMHESTSHTVYVYHTDTNKEEISLFLPIHLRYQRAQITGGYGKVTLQKPSILVKCPSKSIILCDRKEVVSAPCSSISNYTCAWRNVTYKMLSENVEMLVPIGDLDHYPLVSVVTLLIGCAGCIYVLSVLSTTRV